MSGSSTCAGPASERRQGPTQWPHPRLLPGMPRPSASPRDRRDRGAAAAAGDGGRRHQPPDDGDAGQGQQRGEDEDPGQADRPVQQRRGHQRDANDKPIIAADHRHRLGPLRIARAVGQQRADRRRDGAGALQRAAHGQTGRACRQQPRPGCRPASAAGPR